MPGISSLDTPLTFKGVARTQTAAGGFTRADTDATTTLGEVRPATPSEQYRNMQRQQRITHVVKVRWRPDFASAVQGGKVTFADATTGAARELHIKTAYDPGERHSERRRWIVMECEEGVAT